MKLNRHLLARCVVLLGLSSTALTQSGDVDQLGPASAMAAGISLDEDHRPLPGADFIHVSPPTGSTTTLIDVFTPVSSVVMPDFSLTALFGPSLGGIVEISGMSLGNAQLPDLDVNGIPDVAGSGRWLGTIVSVDNAARGVSGSPVARRRSATAGRSTPGADLISFYASQSNDFLDTVRGRALLEQPSERFGYVGSGADEEIDGLDLGIGVIHQSQSDRRLQLFPHRDHFFFTLAPSCLDDVNAATNSEFADDGMGGTVAADACTVYELVWDSNVDEWGDPMVYATPQALGLTVGIDEIDALEVDEDRDIVIFSTQIRAGHSQLKIHWTSSAGPVTSDFQDTLGVTVASELGLIDQEPPEGSRDNIDAVCIIDPEAIARTRAFGIPSELPLGPQMSLPQFGMSMTRCRPSGATTDKVILHASGWADVDPASSASVEFWYTPNYQFGPGTVWLSSNWTRLGVAPRHNGEDLTIWTEDIPNGSSVANPGAFAILIDKTNTIRAVSPDPPLHDPSVIRAGVHPRRARGGRDRGHLGDGGRRGRHDAGRAAGAHAPPHQRHDREELLQRGSSASRTRSRPPGRSGPVSRGPAWRDNAGEDVGRDGAPTPRQRPPSPDGATRPATECCDWYARQDSNL